MSRTHARWRYCLPGLVLLLAGIVAGCQTGPVAADKAEIVYESETLVITKLSEHVYEHTSYLQVEGFGKVDCNGMIVADEGEAIVFDTPAGDSSSAELISWIVKVLESEIEAVVPTHFHADCLGGLTTFSKHHIPSFANRKTAELARLQKMNVPENEFDDSLTLEVGDLEVIAAFWGEGHTSDNIVAYVPSDQILFGGCLVKALKAGKGNLEDANIAAWPRTIENIKKRYPQVGLVIPGHGETGDKALLDYTIKLFRK